MKNKSHQSQSTPIDFKNVSNAVPAMVAVYNIHTGEYLFVNDAVTKILGYKPEEITKKGLAFVSSLVHPDDNILINERNAKALKEANKKTHSPTLDPIVNFEFRIRHKDGKYRWLHTDGSVFSRNAEGKVECVLNASLDITQRKETEEKLLKLTSELESKIKERTEKLQENEHRFKTIFESVGVSLWEEDFTEVQAEVDKLKDLGSTDLKTYLIEHPTFVKNTLAKIKVIAVNDASVLLFEAKNKKELLLSLSKIFLPKTMDVFIEELVALSQNTPSLQCETVAQTLKGKRLNIIFNVTFVMRSNNKKIGLITITDITERKRIEQRKDDFIALASHELKTPVTSLKLYTQVLENKFKKLQVTDVSTHLQRMDGQINKLTKLVQDLLDVSRAQRGKLSYDKELFILDTLVIDTIEQLQQITPTHTFELFGQTNHAIFGDKDRIRQVLINLLTNAARYSPQGQSIHIKLALEHNYISLSVIDFGIGIPDDQQEMIFGRFMQAHAEETQTYPGLGLGLFISKEIIKHHDGHITVESTTGKGSIFRVLLPVATKERKKLSTNSQKHSKQIKKDR